MTAHEDHEPQTDALPDARGASPSRGGFPGRSPQGGAPLWPEPPTPSWASGSETPFDQLLRDAAPSEVAEQPVLAHPAADRLTADDLTPDQAATPPADRPADEEEAVCGEPDDPLVLGQGDEEVAVVDEEPAAEDALDLVSREIARLSAEVERLAVATEAFQERSSSQESVVVRLHDRVQELQTGETRHMLRPVVAGLVQLHGEISLQSRSITRDLTVDQVRDLLEVLAVRLENAITVLGYEPFGTEPGVPFTPRAHQAVTTVPTADPALDKTVAAVLRTGFADPLETRIQFPAHVAVHAFDQAATAPAPMDSTPEDEGTHA